ncbi:MAG: AtpZ/AtpI family protein [Anaerolineae bacterium]|nr:MAG: AtpZ/AtpI family protein [Anaerolineae bacterium]
MSDLNDKKQADRTYAMNVALTAVVGQVGCVTVLVIVLAMFAGLWIDNRFGTKPWFTIGLLVASMPVTVILMLNIVRAATSRMVMDDPKKNTDAPSKEADVGTQDD